MTFRQLKCASVAVFAFGFLGIAGSAHAAPIFFDNFDNETPGLDVGLTNFSVTGSIDVIPSGGSFDLYPNNGEYVDLDGSFHQGISPASVLTSHMMFGPGTYTVSFNLGGNDRGQGPTTTEVSLGGTTMDYTLASDAGFTFQTFTATVTGGSSTLTFTELGAATNVGNILDNVSVNISSVPLPASAPMFGAALLALGAVGFGMKRKRAAA